MKNYQRWLIGLGFLALVALFSRPVEIVLAQAPEPVYVPGEVLVIPKTGGGEDQLSALDGLPMDGVLAAEVSPTSDLVRLHVAPGEEQAIIDNLQASGQVELVGHERRCKQSILLQGKQFAPKGVILQHNIPESRLISLHNT